MSVTADKNQRYIMIALPFVFVVLHHQLPGRPARLLDHDEPLDRRPAVLHPPLDRPVAAVDGRRAADGRRVPALGAEPRRSRRRRRGRARAIGEGRARRPPPRRRRRRRRRRAARRRAGKAPLMTATPDDGETRARPRAGRADRRRARARGRGRASTEDGETITGDGRTATALGLFIGHHGQTIDAIQHLASRVALGDGAGPRYRVVVDADGYRERRAQALEGQADDAADEALRFKRPGRAGRDDRQRAPDRARAPARSRRRRDAQRGRGAGPAPRRHARLSVSRFTLAARGVLRTAYMDRVTAASDEQPDPARLAELERSTRCRGGRAAAARAAASSSRRATIR